MEEREIGDAREVAHVAGNEDKVLLEGRGGNEQIHVGYQLALLPERGAQTGEVLDDRIGERQDGEIAQEVA